MGEAGLVREDKADGRKMEGTQEWIDEYGRVRDEGKMAAAVGEECKEFGEGSGR